MTDSHALELADGDARAQLLPSLGGALGCFEWAGQPILRPLARGETHVRQSACFPLVPFSNRVGHGSFRFAGKTVVLPQNADYCPLPLHGVGWQSTWQVVAASRSEATIALDYRPAALNPAWPYSFRVEQTARLFARGLELELSFQNCENHPQPVGIGWHPYFPRSARMRLAAAVSGMWEADAERLPVRCTALPHPLPAGVDVAGLDYDNCFFGFEGTARIEWPERGVAVTLRSDPALSYLVIFIPPDRPFIAVEPVSHMIDAFHRAHLFLDTPRNTGFDPDTGLRIVAPRARFSVRMQLLCSELLKTSR